MTAVNASTARLVISDSGDVPDALVSVPATILAGLAQAGVLGLQFGAPGDVGLDTGKFLVDTSVSPAVLKEYIASAWQQVGFALIPNTKSGIVATSRTALKSLDTTVVQAAFLSDGERSGYFRWVVGDFTARIAADGTEGIYLKADAISASLGAWVRVIATAISPLWFGAVMDYDPAAHTGTDNAAARDACYNTAILMGGIHPIVWPAGKANFTTSYTYSAATDIHLRIYGAGSQATAFYYDYQDSATISPLSITCTSATKLCNIKLIGFSIFAADSGQLSTPTVSSSINKINASAIKLIRNPVPGTRIYQEVEIRDVQIASNDNLESYFNVDLEITGFRNPKVRDCYFDSLITATSLTDAYDDTWACYQKTNSLLITDCYGWEAYDSRFRGGAAIVKFTSTGTTEGGYFRHCTGIWGKKLLDKDGTSNEPAFQWIGGHGNIRDCCFHIQRGKTGTIRDCLIYNINSSGAGHGAAVPIMIWFGVNSGSQWSVEENRLFFAPTAGPGIAAVEYIRSDVATPQIYYLNHNKLADGFALKYGFRAGAAKHTVYANDNEFQTATNSAFNNNGAAGEQFRTLAGVYPEVHGAGSPEGVITAPVGATYHRIGGGAGTLFYFKATGTGSTGWSAIY